MSKWSETVDRYIREGRPVSGGKAGDTANKQRQQELDMQTKAFQAQQDQLNTLKTSLSPYLAGKTGLDPALLSALRSQFLNSNNATFNQAGQQVRAALGARGEGTGGQPVGGTYGSQISSLMGARAGSQSQGLLGVDVVNAQTALQNQMNAAQILSGNAATLTGTQGVAGAGASSALQSYIQAQANSFGGTFMRSLGGSLGAGIGGGLTGGLGGALTGAFKGGASSIMPSSNAGGSAGAGGFIPAV